MFRFIWIAVMLFAALASHAAKVVVLPNRSFDARVAESLGDDSGNRFIVVSSAQGMALVPTASKRDIVGVCHFDVSKGPVVFNATAPKTYWTFAVYSSQGQQAYALTDVQAGTDRFQLEISQAKDLLAQITGMMEQVGNEPGTITDAGSKVEVATPRGLAVIWIPLSDDIYRPQMEAVLKETVCRPK
jgi:uncharacterized membrane protein